MKEKKEDNQNALSVSGKEKNAISVSRNEQNEVSVRRKERKVPAQPDYGCVPSFFWYTVFGSWIVINLARLVFGMKIRTDKKIKKMEGPLVIVGNHPSYIDPIIMGTTLYGRPINFVAGNFLFRNKVFGHIITKGGCIPKAQYRNDMRTVRAMFKVLSRGGVLGIFPEATRMVDGHSITFDSGLASLVKKAGAGIAVLRTHGAYMTWPRWSSNSWRRGRITAEYVQVIPKEKIAEMSVEEIHQEMLKVMDYNEYDFYREHPQVFRSKAIAAGVENVACICPSCEGKDSDPSTGLITMTSNGHELFCKNCGNHVIMDKFGFFHPAGNEDRCFPDLHQWNEWEKTVYAKEISTPGYILSEKVKLYQPLGEYDYAETGYGTMTIRDGIITFKGMACKPEEGIMYKKGKPVRKHRNRDISKAALPVEKTFVIKNMKGFIYDYGLYLELFEPGGQVDRFYPENHQRIHEICGIIEAMKGKKTEDG
ncbi:MAG: 1-acyl-sn-glycerol-3-phosphate acyltransferase [Clostridiales bacterium]|nr:1-acyl-sn-glycerol-3-phosphate acyltransferase [Clostridiales bacterium]